MDLLYGIALSMHLGFEGDYNPVHPHVRLQHDQFILGAYYNSEYNPSIYAGIELEKNRWNYEFGVVAGYNDQSVYPFFRSTFDINDNIIGFITPGIEGDNVGVVMGIEIWSNK